MPKKKLLFLLAVCLLLAACQGTRKGEQKTSVRIGISLYRADDTFINNLQSIFEAKAKEYEQENGIKVILDIQDAKGSQNVQNVLFPLAAMCSASIPWTAWMPRPLLTWP